jgi:poly(3-hydroxybutyrate) depolymerase
VQKTSVSVYHSAFVDCFLRPAQNQMGPKGHQGEFDDVGFFHTLLDQLSEDYPIDEKRVFSTGISNGGPMSLRLACSMPDRIIGGGHTWPGGWEYLGEDLIGRTCHDVNACEEIWRFFASL